MIEPLKYGFANSPFTILEGMLFFDEYAPLFETAAALYGAQNIFAYYLRYSL